MFFENWTKMKKISHLVICPKCSNAVEMENLIQHLNSHSAPLQKEQQIGEHSKSINIASEEESSEDQGA
jgi:hypothetical protein